VLRIIMQVMLTILASSYAHASPIQNSPEDVAIKYMRAIYEEDCITSISLMHSEALNLAANGFLAAAEAAPKEEIEKFLKVDDIESVKIMSPEQISFVFMSAIKRKRESDLGELAFRSAINMIKKTDIKTTGSSSHGNYMKVQLTAELPARQGMPTYVQHMVVNLGAERGSWKVISVINKTLP